LRAIGRWAGGRSRESLRVVPRRAAADATIVRIGDDFCENHPLVGMGKAVTMNGHASVEVVGFVTNIYSVRRTNHEDVVVISNFVVIGIAPTDSKELCDLEGIHVLMVWMISNSVQASFHNGSKSHFVKEKIGIVRNSIQPIVGQIRVASTAICWVSVS